MGYKIFYHYRKFIYAFAVIVIAILSIKIYNDYSGENKNVYILQDDSRVLLIKWTEINGKIMGQLQATSIQENTSNVVTETHKFEGITNGSEITINFNDNRFFDSLGGTSWSGTVSLNKLTLNIPDSQGNLNTVVFNHGKVDEYNTYVTELHRK